MKEYGINRIEEDCEERVGHVMAKDIYEAAKFFKSITDEDNSCNYKIFEMNNRSGDYLMIGNSKNDLMFYHALKWMLVDEGLI